MTSTFSVTVIICRNQFRCKYLKHKAFSQVFAPFLKSTSIFKEFGKMRTVMAYLFPKLQTTKGLIRAMSKKPRYTTPFDRHSVKNV